MNSVSLEIEKPKEEETIKFLTVGSYIKSLRQAKKLTQTKLAEMAGIDSGYLARIESDQREGSAEVIINIAKALELKPAHKIFAPLDPESLQEKTGHKGLIVYLPTYFTTSDINHIQNEIELLEIKRTVDNMSKEERDSFNRMRQRLEARVDAMDAEMDREEQEEKSKQQSQKEVDTKSRKGSK